MRQIIFAGALILTVFLAGCGSSSGTAGSNSATITLGVGQFTGNTTITINTGGTVTFDDSSGGPHNLVTGTGGSFTAEQGAPGDFVAAGLPFSAGVVKTITFPTAGVYHITCSFHPSMQATITVQAAQSGNGGY